MDISWQGLITGTITVFVITYFMKKAVYAAEPGELKFGLFIKSLGLACLLFSAIPFVVFLTGHYQAEKSGETTALIGLTIGFGIAAIYTLAEGFLVKGTYNESTITFYTPWSGEKTRNGKTLNQSNLMAGATGMFLNLKVEK